MLKRDDSFLKTDYILTSDLHVLLRCYDVEFRTPTILANNMHQDVRTFRL